MPFEYKQTGSLEQQSLVEVTESELDMLDSEPKPHRRHAEAAPPETPKSARTGERSVRLPPSVRSVIANSRSWLRAYTFMPAWLPARLRHSAFCYGAAALAQVVVTVATLGLLLLFPGWGFPGALQLLVTALVALAFGPGPSLLAALFGAFLVAYAIVPPHFVLPLRAPADVAGILLYTAVGVTISVLPSQVERARREAEQKQNRLETILDLLPAAVIIADADGKIAQVNQAFWEAWSRHSLATSVEDYQMYRGWHPGGQPMASEDWALARALRHGETVRGQELEIEAFDGQRRTILNNAAPLMNAEGQVVGGVVAFLDVTEGKRLQRAVEEQAQELAGVLAAMTDGVVVYGLRGEIRYANAAYRALLALDDEKLAQSYAQRVRAIMPRDPITGRPLPQSEWPGTRVQAGEVLAGPTAPDVLVRAYDGRDVLLSCAGAPLLDSAGGQSGAVVVIRDVAERRQLERRTREALDSVLAMAATLVSLPQDASPVWPAPAEPAAGALEPETEAAVAHRLAVLTCGVLGCSRVGIMAIEPDSERLRAVAVVGLPPDQERQWWAEQRQLEARGARFGESGDPAEVTRFRAGEVFVLDMTKPPLDALPNPYGVTTQLIAPMRAGNQLVGMLSLDYGGPPHTFTADERALAGGVAQLAAVVLERERLLREREAARADALALDEANRRMDEFLSIASHELKTPLTTIKMNAQIAERRATRAAQLAREQGVADPHDVEQLALLATRTAAAAERQDRLVSDLLDVSRIQAGRLELRIESLDLVELVRDAVDEQRVAHPNRTVTLTLPGDAAWAEVDGDRVRQVVANYLTNALKYSPAEQPVDVRLTVDGQAARVAVRDRGIGIPHGEQRHVWERFHRVTGAGHVSGSSVGLGLGLYIVREVVERHGGTVGVESEAGHGSTFWCTLPVIAPPDPKVEAP